ncbi:MAG: YqgE/AlgH family protein [Verrucomicrobiota bacterium]
MDSTPRFNSLSGLSGSLLVAHPSLQDPNFEKTVILLPVHSDDSGALGVILNRPTGQTLGEMYPEQHFEKLAHIQIFEGGPVDHSQLILTAWKWDQEENSHKMFFGITSEHALNLIEGDDPVTVRAYLGYAGWSAGQLEAELQAQSWITKPIATEVLDQDGNPALWNQLTDDSLAQNEVDLSSEASDDDELLPRPPEDLDFN